MKKKHALTLLAVLGILAALGYVQFHNLKKFDWSAFRSYTGDALHNHWYLIVGGILVVYVDYFLRALRWKIMLRPVRKTTMLRLTPAMFIGFTAMALLGRPAEL